jgi:hypothetical protein
MANSGTVTAGSAALASQYNNLRDDVLNISTGHTHTGAADAGAQIEGTALKSTGATPGNVLIAGTGGTATTWGTFPGPSIVTSNATAVWTTTALQTTQYVALGNAASANFIGVSGGGTTIVLNSNVAATSRTVRVWNSVNLSATVSGSVAASASGTISPAVAGTVAASNFRPFSTYFSTNAASTALFFAEFVDATTTGNDTLTIRKYSRDLSSNIWNATLVSNGAGTTSVITTNNSWVNNNLQYAPEANMLFGYYIQNSAIGTGTLFAVNADSGSVYTAAIGTGTQVDGTLTYGPRDVVYVPGLSGADGTVHVFGTGYLNAVASQFRQEFTLGSASLSAGSIQHAGDFVYGFNAFEDANLQYAWYDSGIYWDSNASAIVVAASLIKNSNYSVFVGYDRTFGTVLFRSLAQSSATYTSLDTNYPGNGFYRFTSSGRSLLRTGYANDYYAPRGSVTFADIAAVDSATMAGAGSPTHYVYLSNATAYAEPLARLRTTEFTMLGTASAARLVSGQTGFFNEMRILSVRGTGITKFNDASQPNTAGTAALNAAGASNFPMLADGSASVVVVAQSNNGTLRSGTAIVPVTEIRLG